MRVAFLLQDLHHGGVVRWALSLAQNLRHVETMAFVVDGVIKHPKIVQEAKRIAPVIELSYALDGDKYSFDSRNAVDDMRPVLSCDAMIAAGTGHLRQLCWGAEYARILVAHVTPEWTGQANMLRRDSQVATHLVAPSRVAAECFSKRATIIPHGADPGRLTPTIGRYAQRQAWELPLDAKVVLQVGRFDPIIKRNEMLLDALHHLPDDWRVVFVGCTGPDSEHRRMVEMALTEHPGRVVFAPEDSHIGDALAAADCLAITSTAESFSLAWFEAMLVGLPVVLTEFPFVHEVRQKHCDLATVVSANPHPKELAAAIVEAPRQHTKTREAKEIAWNEYTTAAMVHRWERYLFESVPRWQARKWRKQQCRPVGKTPPTEKWHKPIRRQGLRVCYLGAYLQALGGVETWLKTLIEYTKYEIDWSVACYETPAIKSVSMEMLESLGVRYALDDVRQVASGADLILGWGLPFMSRLLKGFDGQVAIVSHGGMGKWNRRWVQAVEHRAHHRIGVSREACQVFTLPHDVIPNGIDEFRLQDKVGRDAMRELLGLNPQDVAVGFVGRISEEKNPLLLAKAVKAAGRPFRAVYVGRDTRDYTSEIRKLAPGTVFSHSDWEMGDIYAALDCVLVASPSEGFSLVTLEAMAKGVPVVSTPVGILPEIEEKHGQLSVPIPLDCDPALAAKALRGAMMPERREIVAKAAQVAREYSAGAMAEKWLEFFQRVTKEEAVA